MNKLGVLSFCALFVLGCQSTPINESSKYRKPASTDELIEGSHRILADIENPQVLNGQTCSVYVNKVTDYLYRLPADHFVPKTPDEIAKLKERGIEVIDTIFQIRAALREKFQDIDARNESTPECVLKIREGIQYARIAEEYVLDWLYQNKVLEFKFAPILASQKPATWTVSRFEGFELKTGDVMVVRGKSYVSAMIARIGDEEGNFSHIAMVGEDKNGKKYVVEALIQYGVIITPLEKWRQAEDARVALYRQPDAVLGKAAGFKAYEMAQKAISKGASLRYDFGMNDDDYSTMFCSEVVKYAYDKASAGQMIIPKYRSQVTKFKNTDYPRSLGVTRTSLFAPYDMEVDPRFDFVAEYRHFPLLRQVRMQDAVLQSIYSWMIEKDYTFHTQLMHSTKAYLAKMLRQFGRLKDTLPTYMPVESIKTNLQFEVVALALEKNIYEQEAAYYKKNGYLPSFQEMMDFNEAYRKNDCALSKKVRRTGRARVEVFNRDTSEFHTFFHPDKRSCDE